MLRRAARVVVSAVVVLALVVAVLVLPPAPPAVAQGIPVIDNMNNINMVLAFAQRILSYANQLLGYWNQIQELRDWYYELKRIAAGNFGGVYGSSWVPRNVHSCTWAQNLTSALGGGKGESTAYFDSVLKAAVSGCGNDLPQPFQALDIQRRKVENATIEAITTVGASHRDLGSIDAAVNALTKAAGATSDEETSQKALAQKTAAAAAAALAINRDIQRQQDALIQLMAAEMAAIRDDQVVILNQELLRQGYWGRYLEELGAR
ncbi:MAG: hypothetical protein JXA90_09225 [Planctomycetes bacterium]|nr:hypothetical protein [Planctomycetota bacterium]